ncbi:MAG: glycosyltransferase [Flavobacteriaceae bacterium]
MAILGKKLMVLSLADHAFDTDGNPVAYEPYVREINLWCELFEEVEIYTNILDFDFKKHKYASFKHSNVKLINLYSKPIDGSFVSKFIFVCLLPFVSIQLLFAIRKYDLVHIRNSALLSAILGIYVRIFSKPSITKWAGSYMPYEGEPLVAKIDRKVVDIYNLKHKVLVYDNIQKKHFVKFIPALMSDDEICQAEKLAESKQSIANRLEIVAIGRLQYTKNFELIPPALALLKKKNPKLNWHFHLIGDGHLRKEIENLIVQNKIEDYVTMYGAKPFKEAQPILAQSHLLIMPGAKEGWPKPVAEAWAHNVYPLAANRGNLPDIVDSDKKGLLFEPTAEDLALKLSEAYEILSAKENSIDLTRFAKEMSLENFKCKLADAIETVL